jgi:predicted RNase H-like nuclease
MTGYASSRHFTFLPNFHPILALRLMSSISSPITTIGIDVGGERKGFHAVALQAGRYLDKLSTGDVAELVHWCVQEHRATVIAIDAPCAWSSDGRARPAERALAQQGIWCFATPTEAGAIAHPRDHYGWMLRGMALYRALAATHPVRDARKPGRARYCFETFPHAITCHLQGGTANARRKRTERRALLAKHGVYQSALTNIDLVDAALCALLAHQAATGAPLHAYGEPVTGLIVVPALA